MYSLKHLSSDIRCITHIILTKNIMCIMHMVRFSIRTSNHSLVLLSKEIGAYHSERLKLLFDWNFKMREFFDTTWTTHIKNFKIYSSNYYCYYHTVSFFDMGCIWVNANVQVYFSVSSQTVIDFWLRCVQIINQESNIE